MTHDQLGEEGITRLSLHLEMPGSAWFFAACCQNVVTTAIKKMTTATGHEQVVSEPRATDPRTGIALERSRRMRMCGEQWWSCLLYTSDAADE